MAGLRPRSRSPVNRNRQTAREVYSPPMRTFAFIAIAILMLAVLATLFAGMLGIARGVSGATSNKLMRYRVLFQGAAILLIVMFMSLLRG